MGLKKCPICGEKFADTYKRCPFCEEDENPRKAKQPKRYEGGGRRLARRDYEEEMPRPVYAEEDYRPRRSAEEEEYRPCRSASEEYRDDDASYQGRRSRRDDYDDYDDAYDDYDDEDRGSPWFKVIMVILIAVIIACLLFLFRGPIGNLISGGDEPDPPSSSMTSDNEPEDPDDTVITDPNAGTEPDVDEPDDPDDSGNGQPDDPDMSVVTGSLALSHEDVSIAGDEKFTLSARSGSGDVTFISKDPSIATVSSAGVVTGVKKGVTEIIVQRGGDKAVCIVRVKSDGASAGTETNTGETGTTVSAGLTLSHEDVTIAEEEKFTLSAAGSGEVTFTSKDSSVATVSASGVVTGVKKGVTEITVQRGSKKAVCIVRVK